MAKSRDNRGAAENGSTQLHINTSNNTTTCRLSCRLMLTFIVVFMAIVLGLYFRGKRQRIAEMEEIFSTHFGDEAMQMFKSFDSDGNGFIDLFEFEPIVGRLIETESSEPFVIEEDIDPTIEVLTIQAFFKPLLIETMSKTKDAHFNQANAAFIVGLDNWKTVNKVIESFPVSKFKAFLPDQIMSLGEAYVIISSNLNMMTSQLSSNRFYPPMVKGKEVIIYQLLSMFHSRPFVHSRFAPQGSIAVIRAQNDQYVDIVFRIHAEFQLNNPPSNPFWFTPGQFTGNIIMRKDASHVESFHLYVPNNRSLNVDMEWLNGPTESENMEVDIGYLPQMELVIDYPSEQITLFDENGNVLSEGDSSRRYSESPIHWHEQISFQEAIKALEVKLYPFTKVTYEPFEDAFQLAEREGKLVHTLLLWGALDDQSC